MKDIPTIVLTNENAKGSSPKYSQFCDLIGCQFSSIYSLFLPSCYILLNNVIPLLIGLSNNSTKYHLDEGTRPCSTAVTDGFPSLEVCHLIERILDTSPGIYIDFPLVSIFLTKSPKNIVLVSEHFAAEQLRQDVLTKYEKERERHSILFRLSSIILEVVTSCLTDRGRVRPVTKKSPLG